MKKIIITIATLLSSLASIYAQTENTTTEANKTGASSGAIIGAAAVVVLGAIIFFMVRNRRKTIGGIQSQDKPDPKPTTTQSINNPGSGV